MSSVLVFTPGGGRESHGCYAIECPFCHAQINPLYLCVDGRSMFAMCPNSDCGHHFVLGADPRGCFKKVLPNSMPEVKEFSDIIRKVSSQFVDIYNQAFCAEQLSLDQICGAGYRRALEFLIKDYLMYEMEDEGKKVIIKEKFLGNCIKEDVDDRRIKSVAERAAWLGNDETHYVRKWEEEDVTSLKQLINLAVHWIEDDVATKDFLRKMPAPKK